MLVHAKSDFFVPDTKEFIDDIRAEIRKNISLIFPYFRDR